MNDYFARQLVSERLASARANLPGGVDVELGPISTGLGEVFQYTLVSKDPKYDATELRTIQDYIVRPILRTVPGVTEVNSFGGLVKQYQVIVKPERLTSFHISLQEIFEALEKNNANASGNFIEHESEQYVVRGLGLVKDMGDIENIIVVTHDHTPDLCPRRRRRENRRGTASRRGDDEWQRRSRGRHRDDAQGRERPRCGQSRSRKSCPPFKRRCQKVSSSSRIYDRTDLVKKAIHTVTKALEEGAIFVLIVLIVLLADVRSALIVTLVLPLSALFAFIMMRWWGLSANLMSLGGLAIGIGMMVDGAVVMVENIHRHLTEKANAVRRGPAGKVETVLYAAKEVGRPIVFGICIIIMVFLPLFTLEGFEGKMFSPLAFTISFALLGSLILSLTLVPTLCTFFLKQEPHEHDPLHIRCLKNAYLTLLKPCVRHPVLVVIPAVLALAGAAALVPLIGTEFLPSLDEGAIAIRASRLPSISLAESLENPDRSRKSHQGISRSHRHGLQDRTRRHRLRSRWASIRATASSPSSRAKNGPPPGLNEELVGKMRDALDDVPGMSASFSQPIAMRVDELVSGVKVRHRHQDFRRRP